MFNGGQWIMVDNGQWWTIDNGGQWPMLDIGQWWTVENCGHLTMVDNGRSVRSASLFLRVLWRLLQTQTLMEVYVDASDPGAALANELRIC